MIKCLDSLTKNRKKVNTSWDCLDETFSDTKAKTMCCTIHIHYLVALVLLFCFLVLKKVWEPFEIRTFMQVRPCMSASFFNYLAISESFHFGLMLHSFEESKVELSYIKTVQSKPVFKSTIKTVHAWDSIKPCIAQAASWRYFSLY